jgi:hypothetical protein
MKPPLTPLIGQTHRTTLPRERVLRGILFLRFGVRGLREPLWLVVIGVWRCHGISEITSWIGR